MYSAKELIGNSIIKSVIAASHRMNINPLVIPEHRVALHEFSAEGYALVKKDIALFDSKGLFDVVLDIDQQRIRKGLDAIPIIKHDGSFEDAQSLESAMKRFEAERYDSFNSAIFYSAKPAEGVIYCVRVGEKLIQAPSLFVPYRRLVQVPAKVSNHFIRAVES